jgi:hypothetical protein
MDDTDGEYDVYTVSINPSRWVLCRKLRQTTHAGLVSERWGFRTDGSDGLGIDEWIERLVMCLYDGTISLAKEPVRFLCKCPRVVVEQQPGSFFGKIAG